MEGGEIFVKKCKSINIYNLAKIISKKIKIIGIQPGEKINEIMIDNNVLKNTYDFGSYYKIVSKIFGNHVLKINKSGKSVGNDFEYTSNNNVDWFSNSEIKGIIKNVTNIKDLIKHLKNVIFFKLGLL